MSDKWIDVWQFKPWWCQPWSIVLTALGIPTLSWIVFHGLWLTGLIAVPFLVWMVFFIGIYPRLMQEVFREQLQKEASAHSLNIPPQG